MTENVYGVIKNILSCIVHGEHAVLGSLQLGGILYSLKSTYFKYILFPNR